MSSNSTKSQPKSKPPSSDSGKAMKPDVAGKSGTDAPEIPGPVDIGGDDHQKITEEFPASEPSAPETPLEREERQRQEAKAMQLDNDQEKANKHDESAAKIRAQVAAQKKADAKHDKDLAAKKKQQSAEDESAALARQERVALDVADKWSSHPADGLVLPESERRIYQLECAVLTLAKVLLETPMTPIQRGKLANCAALFNPPSDQG